MGANDFRQALSDVRVQETCFHGRHIGPQHGHRRHPACGEAGHAEPGVQGCLARGDELALPGAVARTERGRRARQHQRAHAARRGGRERLRHHAAQAVPDDERRPLRGGLDQAPDGVGEGFDRRFGQRRAVAVAGQVDRQRGEARGGQCGAGGRPALAPAADAVQQHGQRARRMRRLRPAGRAVAQVGQRRVTHQHRQRRVHTSSPARTTSEPSSVTVQPRSGRSKWPGVWRPATSLAPVEYRKLPAKARSSVPLKSALS